MSRRRPFLPVPRPGEQTRARRLVGLAGCSADAVSPCTPTCRNGRGALWGSLIGRSSVPFLGLHLMASSPPRGPTPQTDTPRVRCQRRNLGGKRGQGHSVCSITPSANIHRFLAGGQSPGGSRRDNRAKCSRGDGEIEHSATCPPSQRALAVPWGESGRRVQVGTTLPQRQASVRRSGRNPGSLTCTRGPGFSWACPAQAPWLGGDGAGRHPNTEWGTG